MQISILKKNRALRAIFAVVTILFMVLSFQNCAPQPSCSGNNCSSTSSTSLTSSSNTPYQNSNNLVIGGGSSSASSSSTSAGTLTISSGGSTSSGSTSSGTGTSTSGSSTIVVGSGGAVSNNALSIAKQPQSISVYEKADFSFEVTVTGGKYPYTYQWFKDGAAINTGLGTYAFFMDNADRWSKEGVYAVTVKDATGASVSSQSVRLGIMEPTTGCTAGSYFTFTNASYDQAYGYFPEYFDGPRGKFLLHSSYDTANFLYQFAGYTGLKSWTFPALAHLAKATLSCKQNIPRIQSPTSCYSYTGIVTFECHNNKLKMISNTCVRGVYECGSSN